MRVELRLRLLSDEGKRIFGEGPYRLLQGIERLGSLRAAAGELGMAYSKANRVIRRAEGLLGAPLTEKRIGGPDGGGSRLTPLARELMTRYEQFRADCKSAAESSFARRFGGFLAAISGTEMPSPTAVPALGCIVLAAGRAERFGGGKLLADLDGRPVLAHTLAALPRERFCRIVAVSSNPAVTEICREMGIGVCEYPGGALSDSIREGLMEMEGTDGCMFVNGDQPLLRRESLRRMAEAFEEEPGGVFRLAFGGTEASPVVIPSSAYPELRALKGEQGGMAALRGGDWEIRTVEAEAEEEIWDVDDADGLRRMNYAIQCNSQKK